MASFQDESLHHDRKAWEDAVELILGKIPQQAAGDEVDRMVSALHAVSSLLGRMSTKDDTSRTQASLRALAS